MRMAILGWMLVFTLNQAYAEISTTPGAIASMLKAPSSQFQYDPVSDLSVMIIGQQARIAVSVLPQVDPAFALQQIVIAMSGQQYLPLIRSGNMADYKTASLHVKQQSSDWLVVASMKDLNLFIRVQDVEDAQSHTTYVTQLLKSIRLATPSYPGLVSGSYTMGSQYSDSYGSDISAYSESSVTFFPDGRFSTSSYAGVSGEGVSGYSQSGSERGWWQVRGNRLLAFEPPSNFFNYRFEAFTNGLEVYDENNNRLLWVRN
jgi:hypothetical protein